MSGSPRVAVLGPVLVATDDGVLAPVPGALARAFVVTLALANGFQASTDTLIDALWGDDPPRGARAALQTLVSRLRRSTASAIIASTAVGYRLAIADDELDLTIAERAARADGASATPTCADALALWRGEPGDDLDGEIAAALSARASAARRALRRLVAAALETSGDPDGAVRLWTAEAAAHPFDEIAIAGQMRALAAAGRAPEAMAAFAEHRSRLAEELGADPAADLVRLNADLLRTTQASAGASRRVGLRQAATTLIGRDDDCRRVRDLVAANRLVTILGAGGLGKTRVAQDVAAAMPESMSVVFLELAPLGDGADIVPALGALLGIAEVRAGASLRTAVIADVRTRLVRMLAETPTLLVLDNCEHLVDAAAAFASDLLAEVPSLRILATSRAPLAIAGETAAPLAPLPVEADGAAVRLFAERARAARPGASLPVDAVRRICARLDGSPLAIELAAARVRGMSVDEIERRLDDRFALLRGGDRSAPERHRTLLAVIEWSWRLLDDGAQDLLTRLALFPDGVSVEAVEAVAASAVPAAPEAPAAPTSNALDDLAELVEQSLVQLSEQPGEPARYRLLETVREFGAARLDDRGATPEVRRAMIRWAAAFGANRNVFTVSPTTQRTVFREVEREADNLVTLLRWALADGDSASVARIFTALGTYWTVRGAHGEVVAIAPEIVAALRRWSPTPEARIAVDASLVVAGASAAPAQSRTAALAIGALRRLRRDHRPSGVPLVDAQAALFAAFPEPKQVSVMLRAWTEDADQQVACFALALSAQLAENAGEVDLALSYSERAEELAATIGDSWAAGTAAVARAQFLMQAGDARGALAAAEQARERLAWFSADDDVFDLGRALGLASAAVGDVDRARAVADDLEQAGASVDQVDPDREAYGLLAFAVRAEADRHEGNIPSALDGYERAYRLARDRRKRSLPWAAMVAAARIAIGAEATAGGLEARGGGEHSLQTDDGARDAARFVRVAALVQLRLDGWWLDLPIVGCALIGLAVWTAAAGEQPATVARLWGLALRLSARQDFSVLRHDSLRQRLAVRIPERELRDAETASAGLNRTEAVAAARALLEAARVTPSAYTPSR